MMPEHVDPEHLHLIDRLEHHAATRAQKPFVVFLQDGRELSLSFGEVLTQARAIAGVLRQHCGGDGVVFIAMKHSPHMYGAFLGCMFAGLVPSFLPFPSPKQDPHVFFEQHRTLFRRTPPACVMTYAALVEPLRDILPAGVPVLDVARALWRDAEGMGPVARREIALLQHSSGTTGLKKGVTLTFAQIARQTAAYVPVAGLGEASVVVSWLPLYHDMGLFTAFLVPLAMGATVVSIDAFEWVRRPAMLLEAVERHRGTHVWLPNFAFEHILSAVDDGDTYHLDSLVLVASCSEPVKPATLRRFAERLPVTRNSLRACYAMAEASFAVSQGGAVTDGIFAQFDARSLEPGNRPRRLDEAGAATHHARELTSNGRPIPGIEVAIFCDGRFAGGPWTAVGEIVLRGPFVFDAYHRSPELTAAAFADGWYRTGDIGFLDDGELFICGRSKELLIVNGRNFYCHDIETIVSAVPGVVPGRAVAVGVEPYDDAGEQLLLIVEAASQQDVEDGSLARAVKDDVYARLELMPYRIEFVPRGWLVKTTSGKLSRRENMRRLQSGRVEDHEPRAVQA